MVLGGNRSSAGQYAVIVYSHHHIYGGDEADFFSQDTGIECWLRLFIWVL